MPSKKHQNQKINESKRLSSTSHKAKVSQAALSNKTKVNDSVISLEQQILSLFRRTFSHVFNSTLPEILQAVKQHLYNRDYLAAFGKEEYLQAYVVRWSPSRALAYRNIFLETCQDLKKIFDIGKKDWKQSEMVCIGGGAGAEVVAAAAAVKTMFEGVSLEKETLEEETSRMKESRDAGGILDGIPSNPVQEQMSKSGEGIISIRKSTSRFHLTAIDIASWSHIISSLTTSLTTPFMQSNPQPAFICPSIFSSSFHQADIISDPIATTLINKNTSLITLLFTTNELFTQSTPATTSFLSSLADRVSSGTLLLIVESAGSYSMVKVKEQEYPMPWLLDLVLLGSRDEDKHGAKWKKIVEEDSKWYRLPKDKALRYPIELENMRYLVRVYKRI